MPHAVDLEKDLVLAFELDLLVVHAARREHGAVGTQKQLLRKLVGFLIWFVMVAMDPSQSRNMMPEILCRPTDFSFPRQIIIL